MRDYGKVFTRFWTSADIDGLNVYAKLLALYLLTCKHSNLLGCYTLPVAYVACDLGWNHDDVKRELTALEAVGFCFYDHEQEFLLIRNFLKFNHLANWNEGKAAMALFAKLPRSSWLREPLVRVILEFCPRFLPQEFLDTLKAERTDSHA